MIPIDWDRYPRAASDPAIRAWVIEQAKLALSDHTVDAYARCIDDYARHCLSKGIRPTEATRSEVVGYLDELRSRPSKRRHAGRHELSTLSPATIAQRLTAVRLFHTYLTEEGIRTTNPVIGGHYRPLRSAERRPQTRLVRLPPWEPWVPSDEDWEHMLEAASGESLRNRVMFALSYDAALRRQEVCGLQTSDIDSARREVHVRAEITKGAARPRTVPYSAETGRLLTRYLPDRAKVNVESMALFLSESRRNRDCPISVWTWNKVVERISRRAAVPRFTTHSFRHLRLTDLARSGWDLKDIAEYAGHRNLQTTLVYLHLTGIELAEKLASTMDQVHAWHTRMMGDSL